MLPDINPAVEKADIPVESAKEFCELCKQPLDQIKYVCCPNCIAYIESKNKSIEKSIEQETKKLKQLIYEQEIFVEKRENMSKEIIQLYNLIKNYRKEFPEITDIELKKQIKNKKRLLKLEYNNVLQKIQEISNEIKQSHRLGRHQQKSFNCNHCKKIIKSGKPYLYYKTIMNGWHKWVHYHVLCYLDMNDGDRIQINKIFTRESKIKTVAEEKIRLGSLLEYFEQKKFQ